MAKLPLDMPDNRLLTRQQPKNYVRHSLPQILKVTQYINASLSLSVRSRGSCLAFNIFITFDLSIANVKNLLKCLIFDQAHFGTNFIDIA